MADNKDDDLLDMVFADGVNLPTVKLTTASNENEEDEPKHEEPSEVDKESEHREDHESIHEEKKDDESMKEETAEKFAEELIAPREREPSPLPDLETGSLEERKSSTHLEEDSEKSESTPTVNVVRSPQLDVVISELRDHFKGDTDKESHGSEEKSEHEEATADDIYTEEDILEERMKEEPKEPKYDEEPVQEVQHTVLSEEPPVVGTEDEEILERKDEVIAEVPEPTEEPEVKVQTSKAETEPAAGTENLETVFKTEDIITEPVSEDLKVEKEKKPVPIIKKERPVKDLLKMFSGEKGDSGGKMDIKKGKQKTKNDAKQQLEEAPSEEKPPPLITEREKLTVLYDEQKFQSVRVVKNVRQFVKQWDNTTTSGGDTEKREERIMKSLKKQYSNPKATKAAAKAEDEKEMKNVLEAVEEHPEEEPKPEVEERKEVMISGASVSQRRKTFEQKA